MRLVRYGEGRVGALTGEVVVDLTDLTGADEPTWPPVQMQRLIRSFATHRDEIARRIDAGAGRSLHRTTLQAPILWPNKVIGMPANYEQHIDEMRTGNRSSINGFFLKAPSALCGPADPIALPNIAGVQVDHESELALVIGKLAHHVTVADALDHVFGYTCVVDVTVRSQQERVTRKSFDTFAPIGPWITTADEVGDPGTLDVALSVGGETRQAANTRDLVMAIPQIVAMISSVCTLEPGDVIATGSPAGVGPLTAGDRVTIRIQRVGEMTLDVTRDHHDVYELGWQPPQR